MKEIFTMYAVIVTGGKQYKVEEGDVLYIEKLDVEAEAKITFISFSICFIVLRSPFRLKTKKPQGRYSEPCFCHFSGRKSGKIAFLSLSKNHTRYLY
jgi:hypothetical protein